MFTLALLSFWFEDTRGLQLLYRRAVMILGGMLIPLEAYPDWLGGIARALPFRYLHVPAGAAVCGAVGRRPGAAAALAGAVRAGGLVPLLLVYRAALRRLSAQGG